MRERASNEELRVTLHAPAGLTSLVRVRAHAPPHAQALNVQLQKQIADAAAAGDEGVTATSGGGIRRRLTQVAVGDLASGEIEEPDAKRPRCVRPCGRARDAAACRARHLKCYARARPCRRSKRTKQEASAVERAAVLAVEAKNAAARRFAQTVVQRA